MPLTSRALFNPVDQDGPGTAGQDLEQSAPGGSDLTSPPPAVRLRPTGIS